MATVAVGVVPGEIAKVWEAQASGRSATVPLAFLPYLLTYYFSSSGDQVIRENPASRGTEISAEVLVVGLRSKDKNSRSLCRRERRPSYAHTAAPLGVGPREPRTRAALRAANPGVAATTGPSVDVSFLRSAFIIASTPCSCVGIGHQHSGIVRLFEASVTLTNPTYLTR